MEVTLTPEQSDVVRHAVAAGRVGGPEQAVQQAMAMWVERERRHIELLASLDAAETSVARGGGVPITKKSLLALAEDVKRLGRERLAAKAALER
jgi:hypothetical protein